MLFSIYLDDNLIGQSAFEAGDPPMGIVIGMFFPAKPYVNYLEAIAAYRDKPQGHFNFYVKTTDDELVPVKFLRIEDYSSELNEIEVTMCIDGDQYLYQRLFPKQYQQYFGPCDA